MLTSLPLHTTQRLVVPFGLKRNGAVRVVHPPFFITSFAMTLPLFEFSRIVMREFDSALTLQTTPSLLPENSTL